jgi:Ca-activated chloride channel family protein
MSGVIGPAALAEAVTGLVAQLRPAEKVRVAAFNTGVEMGPDFGSGPAPISDYLKTLSYRNATRLYDALDTGLATIERQPGRHIILVLSDGSDTDSRKTSADVLTRALRDDVQIWALRPSERLRGVKGKGPDGSFTRIVQDTGGVSVQPQDSVDLVSSLSDVVRYLREQYAIEVDAAAVDRNVHRVAVRRSRVRSAQGLRRAAQRRRRHCRRPRWSHRRKSTAQQSRPSPTRASGIPRPAP